MPFEFKEQDNGIFVRYFGFVSPSDLFSSREVIRALPNHAKFEFALCDFTDMDADCIWAMTTEIAEAVGKRNNSPQSEQRALRKLALVSPSQKIIELLEMYAENYKSVPTAETRIFRSLPQARAWVLEDGCG